MKYIVTSLLFGLGAALSAQNIVTRNDTVEVFNGSHQLKLAWATGLNSAHIGNLDFNLDGKMDLFVFEPNQELNEITGDKIYPFINQGDSTYVFDPSYRQNFWDDNVILERMAILRDYNCDGKMDIFTHDVRDRVTVYKNVSTNTLKFELVTKILKTDTSDIPAGYWHPAEIYWNWEDVIAFDDVDGDGDMDILSIDFIGSYIEYHKNLSMEKYGNCDSLVFKIRNMCWGFFAEDFNVIKLNTCNPYGNVPNPELRGKGSSGGNEKGSKHSNTSLLIIDLDGDGVKDLLAGDGIRTSLYAYYNGGGVNSSKIVSYDTVYPKVNRVNFIIYAIPFYVDVDFDGKKDLIATVRNDNLQDTNTVWIYKNTGSNTNPTFNLSTKSFLQDEMIDVGTKSKPVFFDYNLDIIIGNFGYFNKFDYPPPDDYHSQLALYENVGQLQAPKFKLVDTDFGGLSDDTLDLQHKKRSMGLHPTFGDLDGDSDEDMILGDYRGKLHYYENIPVNGKADFHLASAELLGIDVGDYSTPQLFDLDNDGQLDLIIGERNGNLFYYKNISNGGNLDFQLMDDSLGNINIKEWWDLTGFSAPFMFRDSMDEVKLLVGTKVGYVHLYDHIFTGDSLSTKFNLVETTYQNIWDGDYSTISGGDLNHDRALDFVLGNQSGGISLYTSQDSIYIPGVQQRTTAELHTRIYPNPANDKITAVVEGGMEDIYRFEIYNTLGKMMNYKEAKGRAVFDIGNLDSGVYILRVSSKKRPVVMTERFVKMR